MMINVTTTLEIDKDNSEYFTRDEIEEIYDQFREVLEQTNQHQDLTAFLFINADTGMEIESEVLEGEESDKYNITVDKVERTK